MILERQWKLLDGNKKLRAHIPTIISSLNIVIGSFYFKSISELKNSNLLFAIIVLLITFFGVWALRTIQEQYDYSNSKIIYLYDKFKVNYLSDFTYTIPITLQNAGLNPLTTAFQTILFCILKSFGYTKGEGHRNEHESGTLLFKIGYVSIILIGVLISLSIFFYK